MSKLSQKIAAKAQARVATRRGAGFLEYALLAAVAIGLALLLTGSLGGMFEGIFGSNGKLDNAINVGSAG